MLLYVLIGLLLVVGLILSIVTPNRDLSHFGKKENQPLRALLAIGIILTHTGYQAFSGWGGVIVAEFFFLSTYGLTVSYRQKGESYLQGFLSKRLLSVLVPFIIAVLLWQVYLFTWGSGCDYYKSHFVSFLQGDPCVILPTSWFIFAIILVYLTFYGCARINQYFREKIWLFSFVIIVSNVLAIYLNMKYRFGSQWFVSSAGLIEGMLVAYYENGIKKYIKQHKVLTLFFSFFSIALVYSISFHSACSHLLLNSLFPLLVLVLVYILGSVNSIILNYIGAISLEIYLVQGVVTSILRWHYGEVLGKVSFIFLCIVLSILLAVILSMIKKPILSWFRNSNSRN